MGVQFPTDVDCCTCAEASLHLRRDGAGAAHPDAHRHSAHARRYLSRHQHSSNQRGMVLRRLRAQRNGRPYRHQLRARHYHHGQRYRTHRVAVGQRHGRDQDFLPSAGQHPDGAFPGHCDDADHGARPAARNHAATDHHLLSVVHSDRAAWPEQQDPAGATTVRPGSELPANPTGNRARRCHALSLRRQDSAGTGRPRHSEAAGERIVSG